MPSASTRTGDVWSAAARLGRLTGGRTVFDVGAHEGAKTASFLRSFPAARVFSFEPDPEVFERLRSRFANEPRVHPVNAAAGPRDGRAEFHRGATTYVSSLFPRNSTGRRYYQSDMGMTGRFPVDVRSLDAFCADSGVERIDLLKLDTQGGELGILKGARGLLARGAIEVLVTEFFFIPHYEGAPLLDEIWGELRHYGYELFDLFHGAHASNGQARYGDAIFVSPGFRAGTLDAFPAEP